MATIATIRTRLTADYTGMDAVRQAGKDLDDFAYKDSVARAMYRSVRTPVEEFDDRIRKLTESFAAGNLGLEYFNRNVAAAKEKLHEATAAIQDAHQANVASYFAEAAAAKEATQATSLAQAQSVSKVIESLHQETAARNEAELARWEGQQRATARYAAEESQRVALVNQGVNATIEAVHREAEARNEATASMERYGAVGTEAMAVYRQTRTAAEAYFDELERLSEMVRSETLNEETYARGIDQATAAYNRRIAAESHTAGAGVSAGIGAAGMGVGAIGGFLLLSKMHEFAGGASEAAIETQRLGVEIGTTTEQTQRLEYAAKVTHTELESLGTGIIRLQRGLADARSGSGTDAQGVRAKAALKDLGLDDTKLMAESTSDAINTVADALSHVANENQRNQIAQELFGRGVKDLLPILSLGADGIRALGDEGAETGNILSHQDLSALTESYKSWTSAVGSATKEIQHLEAELTPATNAIANFVKAHGTISVVVGGGLGGLTAMGLILPQLASSAKILTGAIGGITFAGAAMTAEIVAGAVAVGGWIAIAYKMIEENKSLAQSAYEVARAVGLFHGAVQDLQAAREEYGALDAASHQAGAAIDQTKDLRDRITATQAYIAALTEQQAKAKAIADLAAQSGEGDIGFGQKQVTELGARIKQIQDYLAQLQGLSVPAAGAGKEKDGPYKEDVFDTLNERVDMMKRFGGKVDEFHIKIAEAFDEANALGDHQRAAAIAAVAQEYDKATAAIEANRKAEEEAKRAAEDLLHVHEDLAKHAAGLAATTSAPAGSTGADINELRRFADEREALEERLKKDKADQATAQQDEAQLASNQALEHHNRLEEEAARIRENLGTETEKLARKKAEYDRLVAAGVLTQDEENKALAEAARRHNELKQSIELARVINGAYTGALNFQQAAPIAAAAPLPGNPAQAASPAPLPPSPNAAAASSEKQTGNLDKILNEEQQQTTFQRDIWNAIVNGFGASQKPATVVNF